MEFFVDSQGIQLRRDHANERPDDTSSSINSWSKIPCRYCTSKYNHVDGICQYCWEDLVLKIDGEVDSLLPSKD